jgi:nucleoside-triphosphatase
MLITISGQPHSGKSTLLKNVLSKRSAYGFITREIVGSDGLRTGFELVSSDYTVMPLARVDSNSELRVSRYGVEVTFLNNFLNNLRDPAHQEINYIDEVGEMELLSPYFEIFVKKWLDKSNLLIVTLSEVYAHPLIDHLRDISDAHIDLNANNRVTAEKQLNDLLITVN